MKKFPVWNNYYPFIMRVSLSVVMLISITFQMAYPSISRAQSIVEQSITVSVKSKTLGDVLNMLDQQTHFSFLYNASINPDQLVSLDAKKASLKNVLEKLLPPLGLQYKVNADKVLILKKDVSINADRQITGQITDESGASLPGVTVKVKGTNIATSSNTDGYYIIKVPGPEATLVFSYIGFVAQEVAVGDKSRIDIKFLADDQSLNEVVVTALNFKRNPKSLGYSVTNLNGSKVNTVQTPNLISALSGKVAGVDIGNIGSGVAGSKRVVIRGASSLTGNNQPLWVIDGIPINSSSLGGLANNTPEGGIDYGDALTGINPDDIENISVLKGNAAAALYGSLASNGVILVTTKGGKSGNGKTRIEVSSSALIDQLINPTDFQFDYGQSSRANARSLPVNAADAYSSDSWGHKLDGTPAIQFDGVTRPFTAIKDNYKNFFKTGTTFTNTIALSGSNANNTYRISASDLRNSDIVPGAGYSRTGLNLKTSTKYGKLTADVVLNYTYEKANNRPFIGGNHSNLFYSLFYLPGNIDVRTLKPGYKPDGTEFTYADGISNPYFVANKTHEDDSKNAFRGAVTLQYDFTKLLYTRARFTRDYYIDKRYYYIPDGNLYTSFPNGQLDQRLTESTVNNYEFIVGLHPINVNKFSVNGFVGVNQAVYPRSVINTSGNSFVVPGVYTFNNLGTKLPTTSQNNHKTNSVFGSAELSYNNYLYLTLTGRNDWFSTLPKTNNNLFYPSAALSFVVSDAFKLPSVISFAKVRASTAQVSGDTSPGQLDLSYTLTQTSYNGQPLQYIGSSNIPNKDLRPLLSTDYEFGLEMDFFNGRLGFDADYYHRETKDDIVTTAVASSSGYSTAVLNVGRMTNDGIEVQLHATPVKLNNFSWDLTATFSKNNSKVGALGSNLSNTPILLASSKNGEAIVQLEEGKPYGGIYGFAHARDASGNIVFNNLGYPVATSNYVYLGKGVYDKLMGLSNTFKYGNFSLYTLIDAKFGAKIYSETNATAYDNGKHKATLVGREEGLIGNGVNQSGGQNTVLVTPDNIPTYYKQWSNIAEEFIYDASFVKLREAALRYNFPKTITNKIGMQDASISFVVRNLLTIYKDKNLENVDPESNISSGNDQGIERLVYPNTRNFGLTLKFGF